MGDDQFDSSMLRATLSASRRDRPAQWPRSVSEMRQHTSFAGQGAPRDDNMGHMAHSVMRAPGRERLAAGPPALRQGTHPMRLLGPDLRKGPPWTTTNSFGKPLGPPPDAPDYPPGTCFRSAYYPAESGWYLLPPALLARKPAAVVHCHH